MSQWYNWQFLLHYHHVWWVVLHLKHVMRILFCPKKHFKIRSSSKLHVHLKRELSHETRLPEIIPTTKHVLCESHVSITDGQNNFTTRSRLWWSFSESSNHSTGHHSGHWSTALRRILHISLHKHTFFHTERVVLYRYGFPNRCWYRVITWFIVWPVLSLSIHTLATTLSSMD